MNPAIRFDRVSKRFVLRRAQPRSFQDLALDMLHRRSSPREVFWALRDVSLEVQPGQMVGLIGPNGAGKSTALKLVTRILEPTSGSVAMQGRVAALLELGAGFHPDLTGRENVFLNGSLLGFTRRQMNDRLGSIIDFAGMQRFIDVPVRHYSSGMYMRLGFAIAVHSDPDILITDEVLAVGDEEFQNKCLERMSQFRDQGVTIILVSHALPMVRKLCDRVVWLRQGEIVMDGAPDLIVDTYIAEVAAGKAAHGEPAAPKARPSAAAVEGLADVRLTGVEMIGPDGRPRWRMQAGEPMGLRLHYQLRRALPEAVLTVQVHDAEDGAVICGYNSHTEQQALPLPDGKGSIDLYGFTWPLRRGRYLISVALFAQPDPPAWANPDDLHHKAYAFDVVSTLDGPHSRSGTGDALLDRVLLCDAHGQEATNFGTGATLRLRLRCLSMSSIVTDPVLRVQIFRASDGLLCHATNTDRAALKLGRLAGPVDVTLTYDHLELLEGDYVLSVGLWPSEEARRPYDWHDRAYRFHVHSEHKHGAGAVALSHHWQAPKP